MAIKSENISVGKNILVAPELAFNLSALIGNAGISAGSDGKKLVKAGTPLYGDIKSDRTTAFVKATSSISIAGTAGIWKIQISTAFAANDTVTINGVVFTCAAVEDINGKKFAVGTGAADQVTSLVKMCGGNGFTVAALDSSYIKFTQTTPSTTAAAPTAATGAGGTGVLGTMTAVTTPVDPVYTSNANAVALHDYDVTDGDTNGTVVINGVVDYLKLESDVKALVDTHLSTLAPSIKFIRGAK